MKCINPVIIAIVSAIGMICFLETHLYAATYAYLPNNHDTADSITRILSSDETNLKIEFESYADSGPHYGVAVIPGSSIVLVTLAGSDADDLVARISSSFFSDDPSDPSLTYSLDPQNDDTLGPRGIAIDSDGSFAYVANYDANSVSKINLATGVVDSITTDVGQNPWGIVAYYDDSEDINYVYVANYGSDTVTAITDDNDAISTGDISVGDRPVGIAITPDGNYVYVANQGDNSVSVIQTSDNTVLDTITVGAGPYGVAVGSDGQYVYVTNRDDSPGLVAVISTSSQSVTRWYEVGTSPMGVSAPKNGDFAYVVNHDGNSNYYISKIDISENSVSTITDEDGDATTNIIDNVEAIGVFIGGSKPSAPSSLSAEAVSHDEIELTWNDNSSDELGFKIERREGEQGDYVRIAKANENTTVYQNTGLDHNTTYYYRIQSYNEAADSNFAIETSATTEEGEFSWCFCGALLAK
ncbi:MAG: beta-propeller fold lactonase family protein [Desulfobacteraceae bacterium]|nr:beta-propeller fold lactonase family protein [Desulfobacteraceae bacterium]